MLATAEPAKAAPKRYRATGTDPRHFPTYALCSDHGRTYTRGRLPWWLKREMFLQELDANNAADAEFRRRFMEAA